LVASELSTNTTTATTTRLTNNPSLLLSSLAILVEGCAVLGISLLTHAAHAVFHNPLCGLVFRCGCSFNPWLGGTGWLLCNVHKTSNNDNNNNKNPGQVYIDKSLFYCSFNKIYSSASILFDDDNYVTTSKIYTSSPTPISLKRRDSPLNWRKSVHEMRGAHIITKKKESLVSHG